MKSNQSWAAIGRTLAVVVGTVIVISVLASTAWSAEYKALYRFQGGVDGRYLLAGLVLDSAGNLYGVTRFGGANDLGTVFKLTKNPDGSWTKSLLHSFSGPEGSKPPTGSLTLDGAGNLYGTTEFGGDYGEGTIFKMTPNPDGSWTHNLLYSFTGGAGGNYPHGGVVSDLSSNLYGTTGYGGNYGAGTAFKLAPDPEGHWTYTVLHSFNRSDGYIPDAGVILDASGSVYGTTWYGGAGNYGTAFKLTSNPDGSWTEQVISSFGSDGAYPPAEFIFDAAGNLYSTTAEGGRYGEGTVFKLSANPDGSWTKSNLHSFKNLDGQWPGDALIFDAAGSLYGTTVYGGSYDSGTVFKLTPQPDGHWKFTRLHVFKNQQCPRAALVMDAAGNLYGTTVGGGAGYGVVFRIKP